MHFQVSRHNQSSFKALRAPLWTQTYSYRDPFYINARSPGEPTYWLLRLALTGFSSCSGISRQTEMPERERCDPGNGFSRKETLRLLFIYLFIYPLLLTRSRLVYRVRSSDGDGFLLLTLLNPALLRRSSVSDLSGSRFTDSNCYSNISLNWFLENKLSYALH